MTMHSIPSARWTLILTLVLMAFGSISTAPLWAGGQDEENEEIRKTRVIRVAGPGGRPTIARGYGRLADRAYLGVEAVELTPELREHFGAPAESGVMISRVADDSPAESAGLQVGDVLTTVDDESIDSFVDLFHEISRHEEGDSVRVEVWREARLLSFDATLAKAERPQVDIRHFSLGPGDEHHTMVLPEGDFDEVIELRADAWDEAIDRLSEEWNSEEWQERVHSFNSTQERLLERLEQLEDRLRELEGDLEE